MVQRKVSSKLFIQVDRVKSDKNLANLKLSYSQHQDGKGRGAYMTKKMKKSKLINISDMETLRSSPSKRSLSQQGKPRPLMSTTDESPNYMKPTSSSDAKKELFPLSRRNTQSGSNCKIQPSKVSSNLKASSVTGKKPAKNLRTLTKNPSFKPSRACPRRSSRVALCADMNAQRATCSSTLKDSQLPGNLMLNPGGTESEGTSVMKVCPYTFCSLNGHLHAPLPPLKSFWAARRRFLKTQKTMKLEALSSRRLKLPCETKDSDIEQIVFDGKPACDDADMGNPTVTTPSVQVIGLDFFIEIYAKVKEDEAKPIGAGHGDEMGKMGSDEELDDQEDIKSTIEDNSMAAGEVVIKQITASVSDESPKSGIDFEDFKTYYDDVVIEADTIGSLLREQNSDSKDENHPPSCSHEELSMGSYCSEIINDGEELNRIEMDGSDSEATDTKWEEGQICTSKHAEEVVSSSVLTVEETESKVESLSESSPDGTVLDLEGTDESMDTKETGYASNAISCNQYSLIEEVVQDLTNAEENGENKEKFVDDEVNCARKVLDEAIGDDGQEHKSLKEDGTVRRFLREQNADSADKNHPPSWSQEELSMGSYCSEISNDGEQLDSGEMDGSDSKATNIKWEEGQFCTSKHEEEIVSSDLTEEETESKVESLSENSPDGIVLDLEGTDESMGTQETGCPSNGISCDQCSVMEEVLQDLTNAEEIGEKNEIFVDDEVNCSRKILDEVIGDDGQEHISLKDYTSMSLVDQIFDASEEQRELNQVKSETDEGRRSMEMEDAEGYQDVATDALGRGKEKEQDADGAKLLVESNGNGSQVHKIDETNVDRNSSLEANDRSISQEKLVHLTDVQEEKTNAAQDQELLEKNQGEAKKFQGTNKNWKWEIRHKRTVQDNERMRKINPEEPKFLPLIRDPEPEKVELKHQIMDERKNAEECMLDYALRQVIIKLAPARKRKVALLVEAFETVMPIPKWQTHMKDNSAFAHARTIQACS